MSALLFYLFIIPISLLPSPFLYLLSDLVYFLVYKVFGYRTKVVIQNLRNSYPQKSEAEIQAICKDFYHHLADIILESIKLFTLSKSELRKRFVCTNPELVESFYKKGRHAMGLTCHYANWEWLAASVADHSSHMAIGIYQPLTNPFFEKKMLKSRGKLGTYLVGVKKAKESIENYLNSEKLFVCTIIDQTPSNPEKCYWTHFLNQDTPVHLGMDKYARDYNCVVLFAVTKKVRRGFYEVHYELLCEEPSQTQLGEIAEMYTRKTEEIVNADPQYWLWTHKRWKHKRKVQ